MFLKRTKRKIKQCLFTGKFTGYLPYRRQTEYYFQGRYVVYETLIQNAIRKQYWTLLIRVLFIWSTTPKPKNQGKKSFSVHDLYILEWLEWQYWSTQQKKQAFSPHKWQLPQLMVLYSAKTSLINKQPPFVGYWSDWSITLRNVIDQSDQ